VIWSVPRVKKLALCAESLPVGVEKDDLQGVVAAECSHNLSMVAKRHSAILDVIVLKSAADIPHVIECPYAFCCAGSGPGDVRKEQRREQHEESCDAKTPEPRKATIRLGLVCLALIHGGICEQRGRWDWKAGRGSNPPWVCAAVALLPLMQRQGGRRLVFVNEIPPILSSFISHVVLRNWSLS
jgi:hypothetical protein